MAGGTTPANKVKLKDGVPMVVHRENRPSSRLEHDAWRAARAIMDGKSVWVPSALFMEIRRTIEFAHVLNLEPGDFTLEMSAESGLRVVDIHGKVIFDAASVEDAGQTIALVNCSADEAETGSAQASNATSEDPELRQLQTALALTDRRLQEVERKLAAERRWVVALSQRVEALETLAEQWTAND